jgi:hypothetical protein
MQAGAAKRTPLRVAGGPAVSDGSASVCAIERHVNAESRCT